MRLLLLTFLFAFSLVSQAQRNPLVTELSFIPPFITSHKQITKGELQLSKKKQQDIYKDFHQQLSTFLENGKSIQDKSINYVLDKEREALKALLDNDTGELFTLRLMLWKTDPRYSEQTGLINTVLAELIELHKSTSRITTETKLDLSQLIGLTEALESIKLKVRLLE